MQPSEQLIDLAKRDEGFVSHPYADAVGYQTIGYGHRILPGESFQGLTTEQGEALLREDMAKAAAIIERHVTVPLDQGEFDALCDFVYNLGDRLQASTLLAKLNAGDYADAEQQLTRWIYAGGKPLLGLKKRRLDEMHLWELGNAG